MGELDTEEGYRGLGVGREGEFLQGLREERGHRKSAEYRPPKKEMPKKTKKKTHPKKKHKKQPKKKTKEKKDGGAEWFFQANGA